MDIRPLEAADFDEWLPLWNGYLTFYEADVPDRVTRGVFDRLIDPDHMLQGLVASDGDILLGLTHYFFHPATWTLAPRCYLEDLFVAPSARKRGVGRSLIEAVVSEARTQAADRVYWFTQHDNAAARSLYDSLAELSDFVVYKVGLDPGAAGSGL